jgi:hypothetical protein
MKFRILAVLSLSLFACNQAGDTPPLPEEKIKKVLLDIHLAEAYSSMLDDSLHQSRTKNIDSLAVFYGDIFTHHKITKEEFKQTMSWYKKHPAEFDSLYKGVTAEASLLEIKYGK